MGRKRRPAAEVEREKQLRALEPRTPDGRYNVRDSEGRIIKRDTPEYFAVLGIEPPGADVPQEVVDPQERTPVEGPTVQITAPVRPFPVPPVVKQQSRRKTQQQAEQATMVLLTLLDGAVGMSLGEGARMTEEEERDIAEPMARIMARLDPGTTAMLERWTDPVLLLFGITSWGFRIWTQLEEDDDQRPPPSKVEPTPPSSNGREETLPTGSPPVDVTQHLDAGETRVP